MTEKHPRRQFRDPAVHLAEFLDEVLVRCGRCDSRSVVLPRDVVAPMTGPRRLICGHCGLVREWPGRGKKVVCLGDASDPWFRLPLWLSADCGGHRLWAYNGRHLETLASFVAADLRTRATPPAGHSETMLESLPLWMKRASHRADILHVIDNLRATLEPTDL